MNTRGPHPVCHLEWFINSRCDYACRGCAPHPSGQTMPDLGLDACMEALHSFVDFAAARACKAEITFYPRQAEFTPPFTTILDAARDLKAKGRLNKITCANRGDLPGHKIRLYRHGGVDVCRLTIDGPEPVQDALRRPGSFGDTLRALRATRASGIHVVPLLILVQHNAPHLAATMRILLDEGFDGLLLQAAIRGDVGGENLKASDHPDPDSPWNRLLAPDEYRHALLAALHFLDSAGARHDDFRAAFVRTHQMYARLFFEIGRRDEYERLAGRRAPDDVLPFVLKPDGAVHHPGHMPAIGRFPGGSFSTIHETAHPLRWFEHGSDQEKYMAAKQRAFAKCRACPAAHHCRPTLIAAHQQQLFYYPDVHCWVDQRGDDGHNVTA